ncbi:transglutaminase domain-containing protein [Micromonospora carbonacea]|uniref:transglutaminase domain-containing protein n=1 Tax=Micromonospora carbonacea TaxID=47853 RepID=UPI0033DA503D
MSSSWSVHSVYSDPGRHRALFAELRGEVPRICAAARNVIAHYRIELPELPPARHDEIHSRWLEAILELDQERHPGPLTTPRATAEKVAGCCRDHVLFVVGALRDRGVAARSRVGFASYLAEGYFLDHVVAEYRAGDRWRRVDPEFAPGSVEFDVEDMPTGPSAPFRTAAQVWLAHRSGETDAELYRVSPESELGGPGFVRDCVVTELAHRQKDELLLWDAWGDAAHQVDDPLVDELAELLVRADAGDDTAERELARRYRDDPRLHPGDAVTQYSPYGQPPRVVRLR